MSLNSKEKKLLDQGNDLFDKRRTLDGYFQEVADNFYPERAEFTHQRHTGVDFANNLTTSYPLIARRDLGNALSTFLRPRGQHWFRMQVEDMSVVDNDGRRWLEWATQRQKRFIYDKESGFVDATKLGDHDFVAFGQCVISVEPDYKNINLIHRCWHLRDVAWCENQYGRITTLHRNYEPTAIQLYNLFKHNPKAKLHEKLIKRVEKDPYSKVKCRHIMLATDEYEDGGKYKRFPFVSIWFDVDNQSVIEEVGSWTFKYVIPRWARYGSQYALSPAVVAALPDARLIQAVTLVLLEAGEKAVNPPLIATEDAVRGDIALLAGGITYVDRDYDERSGEALRPMVIDKSGLGFGIELREETKRMIAEAFYLNKINLPIAGPNMTATEITARIQEYIRNALPLFEPIETEYNAALCELQFETLLHAGAFPLNQIPESLGGQNIKFSFQNPLVEAEGREKGQRFIEVKAALAEAMAFDPSARFILDAKTALRDTLNGISTPAIWLRSEKAVDQLSAAEQQQQQAQQFIETLNQGAVAAEQVGKAGQAVQQAGMI